MKLITSCFMMLLACAVSQGAIESREELIYSFLKPVKCTRSGLRCYLRHTLNNRTYIHEFMPRSFMHIIDLLEFGKSLNQSESYFENVFSLFHERFQEAHYVNPYALHELLQAIGQFISIKTKDQIESERIQSIAQQLKSTFKGRFNEFKQNPYQFLDAVAQEIYNTSCYNAVTHLRLQNIITRFLDQVCNKLIWDPREQTQTWDIFVELLQDLQFLYDVHIIADEKVLNQLVWALIYRYGYFIECAGSQLTPESYFDIKKHLETTTPPTLLLEEQEELLTEKFKRLHLYLTEGQMKALAKEQGIITDSVVM